MHENMCVYNTCIMWLLWVPPEWSLDPDKSVILEGPTQLFPVLHTCFCEPPGPVLSHSLWLKCQLSALSCHFLKPVMLEILIIPATDNSSLIKWANGLEINKGSIFDRQNTVLRQGH